MPSGFGDLTVGEVNQIQAVVNQTGKPIDVVGSAARGTRTAASDIDYVVSEEDKNLIINNQAQLPKVDKSHGILTGRHNPAAGPAIRFTLGNIEPANVSGTATRPLSHD